MLCVALFKMPKRKFSEQLTSENSTKKVRQYSAEYLNFGFVRDVLMKPNLTVCCAAIPSVMIQ